MSSTEKEINEYNAMANGHTIFSLIFLPSASQFFFVPLKAFMAFLLVLCLVGIYKHEKTVQGEENEQNE